MENNKNFTMLNLLNGLRIDLHYKDIVEAATNIILIAFDRDKAWDAKKTEKYSQEEAVILTGYGKDDGKFMTLLIIKKKIADNENIFEEFTSVE